MHTTWQPSLYCRLSICVPCLCSPLPVSSFFPRLFRPTQIQMNFISIAGTVPCWQSVVSSSAPPRVCVCVCADAGLRTVCTSCGCYLVAGSCWASPVHQSTSRQWVGVREQPCPLHIFAPPSVSTHPSPSVFFSSIFFFFSPLSSLYFIRSPCSQRWT